MVDEDAVVEWDALLAPWFAPPATDAPGAVELSPPSPAAPPPVLAAVEFCEEVSLLLFFFVPTVPPTAPPTMAAIAARASMKMTIFPLEDFQNGVGAAAGPAFSGS